jgi:hypothetical protein
MDWVQVRDHSFVGRSWANLGLVVNRRSYLQLKVRS